MPSNSGSDSTASPASGSSDKKFENQLSQTLLPKEGCENERLLLEQTSQESSRQENDRLQRLCDETNSLTETNSRISSEENRLKERQLSLKKASVSTSCAVQQTIPPSLMLVAML